MKMFFCLFQIYDLLGLPQDLLIRYKAGLEAVQPEDLVAAGNSCSFFSQLLCMQKRYNRRICLIEHTRTLFACFHHAYEHTCSAARRHVHPDQQVTVIVGDAKTVSSELKASGFEVHPLKL
jgi:organic hydroperoxide reductase OsmC/OhrA